MTTLHFNMIKKHSEKHKEIDTATASFYMSTLSIPALVMLVQFEPPAAFDLLNRSSGFYVYYVFSLTVGIMLTFSQNLCTVVNSPIVTSIIGNVKDVLLTSVSLFVFDDVIPNFWLVLGLALSLSGAFIYSIPKLQQQNSNKKE